MDDIGLLKTDGSSVVPEGLREKFRDEGREQVIEDPEEYSSDLGDCSSCDRQNCEDCDRVSLDDGEHGYCPRPA